MNRFTSRPILRLIGPLTIAVLLLAAAHLLLACAPAPSADAPSTEASTVDSSTGLAASLDAVAEDYVRLVLGVGEHDADFVDAYYGPEDVRSAVRAEAPTLDTLAEAASDVASRLAALDPADGNDADADIDRLRLRYLVAQTRAVVTRIEMLQGARLTFDEESAKLYDAIAPHQDAETLASQSAGLMQALAAEGHTEGTLGARYGAFMAGFVVPPDQVDTVFRAAIDACRARTAERVELPASESFTVEYVRDKPWSAYNWYQGDYTSRIQVNLDLPITIDRAVDLACHEGYPGHHVYNLLLEKHLVDDRGWSEYQVYPLFSPQSLIAEGTANFGVEMAFPGPERLAFERDVLFPLAGLDSARADAYETVRQAKHAMRFASNDAARRYLDGEIDADTAAADLVRFSAMTPPRAAQRVRFIDRYRSYVINYNLGADLVADYIDDEAGDDAEARWEVFRDLLSSPRLPSGLMP